MKMSRKERKARATLWRESKKRKWMQQWMERGDKEKTDTLKTQWLVEIINEDYKTCPPEKEGEFFKAIQEQKLVLKNVGDGVK